MAKNLKVTIDSEEFRNSFRPHMPKEYHETIMRLVSVINREDMSLSGYIDHVLTEHFQKYGEVIKEVYKKNNKDIIMW